MAVKNHFQGYISVHKDRLAESYPPNSPYNEPISDGEYERFGGSAWEFWVWSVPVVPGDFVKCVMSYYRDGDAALNAWLRCSTDEDEGGDTASLTNRAGRWDTSAKILDGATGTIPWTRIESTGYVPAGVGWLNFFVQHGSPAPPTPWGARLDQVFVTVNGALKIRIKAQANDFPSKTPVP